MWRVEAVEEQFGIDRCVTSDILLRFFFEISFNVTQSAACSQSWFYCFCTTCVARSSLVQFVVLNKLINCPAENIEQENVYSKSGWAMQILIGRINYKKKNGVIDYV